MTLLPPVRRILFLAANPQDTGRLRLDEEVRDIQEGLRLSSGRDNIIFHTQWATRIQDLRRSLLAYSPQIVHFSGHGAGAEGLVLEDDFGKACCIQAATLARLFKLCPNVQCVLLNACYSQVQAEAIAPFVPYVIGMNQAVEDATAIKFVVGFYDAVGYGRPFSEAYEFGMTAIEAEPSIIRYDGSTHPESQLSVIQTPVIPILLQSDNRSVSAQPSAMLLRKASRDRTALLNKVKNYWVKGVLEHSLHDQILIELGLEARQDFANPFNLATSTGTEKPETLDLGTQPIDVFDELGMGRSLLILGEPGSGKTTTLLHLARSLLTRAEQDSEHLIPAVFNLSSWNGQQSIADWLVKELNTKYQVPKAISKPWVTQRQLLLLLDGLDEVALTKREACVNALNQFQQIHSTEMVVCSRIKDYEALSQRLTVQQAIYVRSLEPSQIDYYIECLDTDLSELKKLLAADVSLQELAKSPLMLNIMVLAYESIDIKTLPKVSLDAHRRQIFNAYISRMLKRHGREPKYSPEHIVQYLSWLAQQMVDSSQTIFLIEWLHRDWLRTHQQRWMYIILSAILTGFVWVTIVGVSIGLHQNWLMNGFLIWMIYSFFTILQTSITISLERGSTGSKQLMLQRLTSSVWTGVMVGFMVGVVAGIITTSRIGWIVAIFTALTVGVLEWLSNGKFALSFLEPVEVLRWSWKNVRKYLLIMLIGSTPFGLVLGATGVLGNSLIQGWLITLFGTSIYGLLMGLRAGAAIEVHATPNQGIWRSLKTAVLTTSIILLVLVLAKPLLNEWIAIPKNLEIFFSLWTGLLLGGTACIVHFCLRVVFYLHSCIPWNYRQFLDQAARAALLQKVGGGYIFIHRSLMEHFAQLELTAKSSST